MKRDKIPLDKLSPEQKKVAIAEEQEKIETLGQDSNKKAKKWVEEEIKEQDKQEKKHQDDAMEILTDARKKIFTYKDALLKEMRREMINWLEDLPQGFTWHAMYTSKGLVLWLRNNKGEWYAKGLKLSGEPKYDLNGIARLIVSAIKEANDQVKPKKTDGIILPYK